MMALRYATADEMIRRWTQSRINAATALDGTVTEYCIESAADKFDSYAGARYSVPLTEPVPGIVRTMVLTLAAYDLATRYNSVDDRLRLDYEDALQWLRDLAKGVVTLAVEPPPTASAVAPVSFSSSTPKFTRTSFSGI